MKKLAALLPEVFFTRRSGAAPVSVLLSKSAIQGVTAPEERSAHR